MKPAVKTPEDYICPMMLVMNALYAAQGIHMNDNHNSCIGEACAWFKNKRCGVVG